MSFLGLKIPRGKWYMLIVYQEVYVVNVLARIAMKNYLPDMVMKENMDLPFFVVRMILTEEYKEEDIEFVDVKIDSRFEREDKQPDVIATTHDNKQYLIEFVFNYKVQHKQDIDYHNLTCLEVDLSNQTLETLEQFLLSSNADRRWINNEVYFNEIESIYRSRGKSVKVASETDCQQCNLRYSCCAVKETPTSSTLILIENNGQKYRLCKTELREQKEHRQSIQTEQIEIEDNTLKKTCFNCEYNLSWANKNGLANCGLQRPNIPKRPTPDYAISCPMFKRKR